jgi:integrase/recombinase XerD
MNLHFEALLVTGFSADTVRARRIAIRRFISWCDARGLKRPTEITKQALERYQRHLFYYRKPDGSPLTLGSQTGCLAPLKAWFKWLARENHILYNPASELDLPRQSKRLPRTILSVREVEGILAEADVNTPSGLRDRALLELLYSTGLRRMEAAHLAVYDVDFDRRIVMVREGKGRRDRVTPIGARALLWLDKYLLEARPQLLAADNVALFVTDYGEPVTPEFVAARVKAFMRIAGIDKPGAAHLLRHACATHMLEGGADIRFLQAMLGHASLETTQIYTHVAIEKLQAIHEATHPARLDRQEKEPSPKASVDARKALQDLLESDAKA